MSAASPLYVECAVDTENIDGDAVIQNLIRRCRDSTSVELRGAVKVSGDEVEKRGRSQRKRAGANNADATSTSTSTSTTAQNDKVGTDGVSANGVIAN